MTNTSQREADERALFMQAIESTYPIPNTPHQSVAQRAMDDRAAFSKGWDQAWCQSRAAIDQSTRQAAPEVHAYEMSEGELKRLHRVLSILGVAGVEELDTETSMACLWSLMGELIRNLESTSATPTAPQAATTASASGESIRAQVDWENGLTQLLENYKHATDYGITSRESVQERVIAYVLAGRAALARAPLPAQSK